MSSSLSSARRGRDLKADAGNRTVIAEHLESINRQQNFGKMISYSMECFLKMAVSEVAKEELIDCGIIECLAAVMQKHEKNEKLMAQFVELLSTLAHNERLAKLIGDKLNGKFDFLSKLLRGTKDQAILVKCCEFVPRVGKHRGNLLPMTGDQVPQAICEFIPAFPTNFALLTAAGKALATFAQGDKSCVAGLIAAPALRTLIASMVQRPEDVNLCIAQSSLIRYCAENGGSTGIAQLKTTDAVDSLLVAVEFHPFDEELLEHAAAALKLLTGSSDMAIFLNIMNSPIEINEKTLAMLNKLAGMLLVPENVEYFVQHKGIPWLIAVLGAANELFTPIANKILVSGCTALKRCAIDEPKIYEILRHKGVPLLISIATDHADDKKVVAAGLGALAKLIGTRKENAEYLVKHGAANSASSAAIEDKTQPDVARTAAELLHNLAIFPSTHDPLVAGRAIPALCGLVDQYKNGDPKNKPIATQACKALNMLGDDDKNLRDMAANNLPATLIQAIRDAGPDDGELVKAALTGLQKLGKLKDERKKMLDNGVIDALKGLLDRFTDDEIIAAANRLIPFLLKADEEEALRKKREQEEEERRRKREQEEEERRRKREQEEREKREMEEAFQKMLRDEQEAKWKEEQRLKAMREEEERKKREAELAELERIRQMRLQLAKLPDKKPELGKSARAIFGDDDDKKGEFELSPATKQFLLAGQLLMKHSKTAQPRQRHFFMSPDCEHLNWKDPKQPLQLKHRMRVYKVFSVSRGCTTPQLQRKTLTGKPLAQEDLAFSVHGADDDTREERTVDFEAATNADRERWVNAIEELIEWAKAKKLYGAATVKVGAKTVAVGFINRKKI